MALQHQVHERRIAVTVEDDSRCFGGGINCHAVTAAFQWWHLRRVSGSEAAGGTDEPSRIDRRRS